MRRRRDTTALTMSAHGTLELLAGMAMLVAPVVLGFGATGLVVSVVLGAVLMGMGMMLQSERIEAVGWHRVFDNTFVLVTALAAVALGLGGERDAGVFLAVLAAVQSLLSLRTRYVAAG
jgi:hypothetical protein